MNHHNYQPTDYNSLYKSLNSHWRQLCNHYLPLTARGSIWRYSRQVTEDDPEQGWKLHVAATVLSATEVFEAVSPFLQRRGVLFKAPISLYELHKLNSGELYGYSQVGKFITVYPQSEEEALRIARRLHLLTRNMVSPSIPFDLRYRADGCVYYRYGAFKVLKVEEPHGDRVYAMRDPKGRLVPDLRQSLTFPNWVSNPFHARGNSTISHSAETPLQTTFRAFKAITQRGRGGVYQALDLSTTPARLCILKEGRKHGEVDWDGRDGSWRVRHEARVLSSLSAAQINVPQVYASFEVKQNSYVAMELIDGESLNQWLSRRKRRVSIRQALEYGVRIAALLARIHAAGWVWRDCKPGNIMITRHRALRAIDFEGACLIGKPDPSPWGTRFFVPPEWDYEFRGQSRLPEDLYALGAIIQLLVTGVPPDQPPPQSSRKPRQNIPKGLKKIVASLLQINPQRRPQALVVLRQLERMLNSFPVFKTVGKSARKKFTEKVVAAKRTKTLRRGEAAETSHIDRIAVI